MNTASPSWDALLQEVYAVIELIATMFSYHFMQRALIVGVLVSLCAALLGVSLVLKRYSMIGDGLSHVSFGSLAIAVALDVTPLYFSIPVVILAAFLLRKSKLEPFLTGESAGKSTVIKLSIAVVVLLLMVAVVLVLTL